MRLKLLTPTRVVVDEEVRSIVAEGTHGSFGLLTQHVDFLAAIVPGLLIFETQAGDERFAAVDEGFLVKQGDEVLISTRQATRGSDLEELRQTVQEEFMALDESERAAQTATARLEASFLRDFMRLAEERV